MDRLGIIPAAGRATRFQGVMKEMLPTPIGPLILHACASMRVAKVNDILIVTNAEKIGALAGLLPGCLFAIQRGSKDAWSAIVESFRFDAGRYFYAMPDTIIPPDVFDRVYYYDFMLGLFDCVQPSKFGVLRGNQIIDKQEGNLPCQAWGVAVWSCNVVNFWRSHIDEIETHTQAFNMAMDKFGFDTFKLDYYYDCGTFEDYREVLAHV
jgi:hypothetical protein